MTPNPIRKVLSTLRRRKVRALLMGGQACILYGAAEFTRDVDLAVAVSPGNLRRLRQALTDLRAETIYFPPLSVGALRRGHACHFRSRLPSLHGLRIDVMSRMRGVASFAELWKRRVEIRIPGVGPVAVLSLPDLIRAKKTQRDKDWPMIRRLVDADVARAGARADPARLAFWFAECRTFEVLRHLALRYPEEARQAARSRPAVGAALRNDPRKAELLFRKEEDEERERDRIYWKPLRRELERWRLGRR